MTLKHHHLTVWGRQSNLAFEGVIFSCVKSAACLWYCTKLGLYCSGILGVGLILTYTCRLERRIWHYCSSGWWVSWAKTPSWVSFLKYLSFFPCLLAYTFEGRKGGNIMEYWMGGRGILGCKGVTLACCFNKCGWRWPCWRWGPIHPSCCGHSWCESAHCSPLAHQ